MLSSSKNLLKKILVIFLIITLTYYNFAFLGSKFMKGLFSYALDEEQDGTGEFNTIDGGVITNAEIEARQEFDLTIDNSDIHKTTMLEETKFIDTLKMSFKNIAGKASVEIKDLDSVFFDNDGEEIEGAGLKYKNTIINKEELINILGEDGTLVIKDKTDNKILVELSKETINNQVIDEKVAKEFVIEVEDEEQEEQKETRSYVTVGEEIVTIEYAVEVRDIIIEVHDFIVPIIEAEEPQPQDDNTQGTEEATDEEQEEEIPSFEIKNTKCIYNIEDVEQLNHFSENVDFKFTFINRDELIEEISGEKEATIKFKDTITRVTATLDTQNWLYGSANTVKYTITLDTTSDKSELFVNPFIALVLPECVESVNAANCRYNIENNNGAFTIDENTVTTEELLGRNGIKIDLKGAQTEETIQNGNTVIHLSLELNITDDQSITDNITKVYFLNDTVTTYENEARIGIIDLENRLGITFEGPIDPRDPDEPQEPGADEPIVSNEETVEQDNTFDTKVSLSYTEKEDNNLFRVGEEFEYFVFLTNNATEEVDIRVEDVLPNDLEFVEAKLYDFNTDGYFQGNEINLEGKVNYNYATRHLAIDIDNFEAATVEVIREPEYVYNEETGEHVLIEGESIIHEISKVLKIRVRANTLEEGLYSKVVDNEIEVYKNDTKISELNKQVIISDVFLKYTIDNIPETIEPESFVEVSAHIQNLGLIGSDLVNISVTIPEELEVVYVVNDDSTYNYDSNTFTDDISVEGEKTYTITVVAKYTPDLLEERDVNVLLHVGEIEKTLTTTLLTNEVPLEEEAEGEEVTEPSEGEEPLPQIPDETGEEPVEGPSQTPYEGEGETNPSTGNIQDEDTNETGTPEEPGEEPGENPSEEPGDEPGDEPGENPGEEPGENPGENSEEKPKDEQKDEFDLSLAQYINKITVTNSQGTTVYDYKDNKFAKVEIASKYMNESIVTLEYKIVLKNEGTINGYARKIIDYIPTGLEFNSELNPDWYIGEDGNLYSVKYIDTLLKPGEEKELTLILSKKMTNTNTGTIKNIIEIYEATSETGAEDINSIPGNKLDNENDMSTVEVMIAVKTGTIVLYTFLLITILAILVYGIYNVKKLTLSKGDK